MAEIIRGRKAAGTLHSTRLFASFAVLIPLLSGCADLAYVQQAATGHLGLLWNSRPIDEVIEDPSATPALRRQLSAARDIRRFASDKLRLPDNRSYTRFADTGKRFVVWNVLATQELSLKLQTFCFPAIGCLSYKGFYQEADAQSFAELLKSQGLDVAVAGVPAYSTLGWTPDPLLNTFIHYPQGELARLIFHELAHQVLYIPDDTTFNESFASAVEEIGVQQWLHAKADPRVRVEYERFDARRRQFQVLLMQTRSELKVAFDSSVDADRKRQARDAAFESFRERYRRIRDTQWDGFTGYDRFVDVELSTPRLAGVGLYRQWVGAFKSLYLSCDRDFSRFYEAAAAIGRLQPSTRQQRLTAMEDPELTDAMLLPDFVVSERSGRNDCDAVIRAGDF